MTSREYSCEVSGVTMQITSLRIELCCVSHSTNLTNSQSVSLSGQKLLDETVTVST